MDRSESMTLFLSMFKSFHNKDLKIVQVSWIGSVGVEWTHKFRQMEGLIEKITFE